jgi:hypothetical protein
MLGQHFCIAFGPELVQEPRRPLDVREQKRDCPGREIAPHCDILYEACGWFFAEAKALFAEAAVV